MSSLDEDIHEPFQLSIATIQGNWLCEELGVSLKVVGQSVQYSSGECYQIDVSPEGKLEIFGYRGVEKRSDASSIAWKHKENGQSLTWMYEGDGEDAEPEVDASLILHGTGGRSSRKRKVDYVALDKKLDEEGAAGKQSTWHAEYSNLKGVSQKPAGLSKEAVELEFTKLKSLFHTWIASTNTARCKEILTKRGYVSTEFPFGRLASEAEAADRFVSYVKSTGARAAVAQSGQSVQVRVPESVWNNLLCKSEPSNSPNAGVAAELVRSVESIRGEISNFCENPVESEKERMCALLDSLDALPVDMEILKVTKIGVEINKLSKHVDRAKHSLVKLKEIYVQSKK